MPEKQKKLFLLDAFALIYRAYFAFSNNQRFNSSGLNTSAILGFTNTLVEILKKEKPSHIAVIFDTAAPTVRHQEFSEYKANREAAPEDLSRAIPYVMKVIEGFNIPVIFADGFEADDIIGTLAKRAEKEGFTTYMMTPDKDFGQLVSENIFVYKPARFGNSAVIMGIKEVCARYEIQRPEQVIDILGLMGDKVDNIPGIPGVGEKTAIQLIKDFGSIENLLQNTDKVKGKLREKIEQNVDKAIQSKRLATIICDVPIAFNEEQLELKEPNKDVLKTLFAELEFRRLAQQILGQDVYQEGSSEGSIALETEDVQDDLIASANPAGDENTVFVAKDFTTINTVAHQYHLMDTAEKRAALIVELGNQKNICFDTETTGLDAQNAELVGISFSFVPTQAYYVPIPEIYNDALSVISEFKSIFENPEIEKTGQNIKYDISILKWYDIDVKGKFFDTMLAHYLIRPEMRHNMNILAETYLNYSPVTIESLIGKKGKAQLSMRSVPMDQLKEYAAEDADITLQLKNVFEPMLKESHTLKLFEEVEVLLIPVLAAMEAEGIKVDQLVLKEFSGELGKEIDNLSGAIQEMAGMSFNIASPKQTGEVLFDILKIVEKPKKTKTGQYATGEEILTKLVDKHPIVNKILDYRELQKLKNTYVDTLPELINPRTGRVHTSYNQVVAVTGRLSSDNPNLQNIPIRTEKGREVRKAFIARNENHILLSADYSQIELRIIAELSKDPGMMEAFQNGLDIHAATASKVYSTPLEEVTKDMRRNAKMVNFGIIYGISAFGLSERLNIPRKEAANIIEQYFLKYPMVREYMDSSIVLAKEKGYVETMMGRRRYLRDITSNNAIVRGFAERNAINAPIQGTAADMIKIAMINIHTDFIQMKLKSKMLLQVHDELVFDVFKEELEIIKPIIEHRMKTAIPMTVPIEIGMGVGKNWLEAH